MDFERTAGKGRGRRCRKLVQVRRNLSWHHLEWPLTMLSSGTRAHGPTIAQKEPSSPHLLWWSFLFSPGCESSLWSHSYSLSPYCVRVRNQVPEEKAVWWMSVPLKRLTPYPREYGNQAGTALEVSSLLTGLCWARKSYTGC